MKVHNCKCHDKPYTVCRECQHQYCPTYWQSCPSCAEARSRHYVSYETQGDEQPVRLSFQIRCF